MLPPQCYLQEQQFGAICSYNTGELLYNRKQGCCKGEGDTFHSANASMYGAAGCEH